MSRANSVDLKLPSTHRIGLACTYPLSFYLVEYLRVFSCLSELLRTNLSDFFRLFGLVTLVSKLALASQASSVPPFPAGDYSISTEPLLESLLIKPDLVEVE